LVATRRYTCSTLAVRAALSPLSPGERGEGVPQELLVLSYA